MRGLRRCREHENDPLDLDRQFRLLVEWSGVPIDQLRVDDPTVRGLFDAFAPEVVRLDSFDTIEILINEEA